MSKINKLFSNYFAVCDENCLENTRREIFLRRSSLSERKKSSQKHKKIIEKLAIIFRDIVIERNNIAQDEDFSNYFQYTLNWAGVSSNDFSQFLKTHQKVAAKISNYFSSNDPPDWHMTIYNNFDFSYLYWDKEYAIPKYIFSKLNISKDVISKIKLNKSQGRYFKAMYDQKTKSVKIHYETSNDFIDSAILFAHEIGHAITYLKLLNRDINPDQKKWYWHEKRAIETELRFESKLPLLAQKATRDRILYHFAKTLFEYSIYNNPNQDFSKAFAVAHNDVYPSNQKKNPFYVLDSSFINEPCYSTLYSVIYAMAPLLSR